MIIRYLANGGGIFGTSSVRDSRSLSAFRKPFIFLSLTALVATFAASLCCACTQDGLDPRDPVTRADSTAVDSTATGFPIDIDTTWAGEKHYYF